MKGYLIFEDGSRFEGELFGNFDASANETNVRIRKGAGEIVFNTSMTGYQEILTDPSYFGEIVCLTTAQVGNTGFNSQDFESKKIHASGFVIGQYSEFHSSWRAEKSLGSILNEHGLIGIHGVDTRSVVRLLVSKGVQRGLIIKASDAEKAKTLFSAMPEFAGKDLIKEVTTPAPYVFSPQIHREDFWVFGDAKPKTGKKIAVLDFGAKYGLLHQLARSGAEVKVFPAATSAEKIVEYKPDGVFLSNGPGDPAAVPYAVDTIKQILGKYPVFGVCMGHQLLALAIGAKTFKLKFGHRGGNHPVQNANSSAVEISAHNHGFSVDEASLPSFAKVLYKNLNDGSVEGLEISSKKAFSVQYHPEACPGPHDGHHLFDRFFEML